MLGKEVTLAIPLSEVNGLAGGLKVSDSTGNNSSIAMGNLDHSLLAHQCKHSRCDSGN